jgi:hypothetical protein
MALEQSGPSARRLRRTDAAKTLDPSEKGAINYFLGMTVCKLFSERLLQTPWLLHLDVFRPQLDADLRGRSRPDLVGQTNNGDWIAIESKGRVSPPSTDAKNKAKEQAERLISVGGVPPSLQIGCITFFRNDYLHFYWQDPTPNERRAKKPIKVIIEDGIWRNYYLPIYEFMRSQREPFETMLREQVLMKAEQVDIELGIHPFILRILAQEKWADAVQLCRKLAGEFKEGGYQADGIRVVAGQSWYKPFVEFG